MHSAFTSQIDPEQQAAPSQIFYGLHRLYKLHKASDPCIRPVTSVFEGLSFAILVHIQLSVNYAIVSDMNKEDMRVSVFQTSVM